MDRGATKVNPSTPTPIIRRIADMYLKPALTSKNTLSFLLETFAATAAAIPVHRVPPTHYSLQRSGLTREVSELATAPGQ
ncbi:hypothetical protein CB1_001678002 [Camelus ferus]|nr:hypothetical protein CB1_001678002 [Camelus ferus]